MLLSRTSPRRVAVLFATALCVAVLVTVSLAGTSGAAPAHQPDAWVKLCGPTNTCVLQPWRPWIGNGVYIGTGRGETILAGVEEGNMIRFWVLFQNDGTSSETFKVKGCSGTSAFPLKSVNVGAYRAFTGARNITTKFKSGTARFSFPPNTTDKTVIVTLTFLAATSSRGRTYSCPVTVSSTTHAAAKDTVVAKMITI
jgi:hypothetical protein